MLPASAPSERTTIEPEPMSAAVSIASACATASKMCVPPWTGGTVESAAEIFVAEVVSGSSRPSSLVEVDRAELLVPLAVGGEGLLRGDRGLERSPVHAVARVQHEHDAEGLLRGLARRNELRLDNGFPVLGHADVVERQRAPAWQRQNVGLRRVGGLCPRPGSRPFDDPAAEPVAARTPTARTSAAVSESRFTDPPSPQRPPRRAPARGPGRARAEAQRRASRTSGGSSAVDLWRGDRPRSCRPASPRRSGT